MAKLKLYHVFGKKKNETFGNFYTFQSSSAQGAAQKARRKYNIEILSVNLLGKYK